MKTYFLLSLFTLNAWGTEGDDKMPGTYRSPQQRTGEYQRPLTDQERIRAMGHHHGLIERTKEAECAKSKTRKEACSGERATAFGDKDDIIKMAGQAFSLFMAQLGDGKITAKKAEESTNDFCGYIPPAITMVAQTTQKSRQKAIGVHASEHSAQQQYLYKQSRTHRARAKTASIEVAGWGATTACYVGMASKYGFQVNKSTYLKMGAAAFLTYFYQRQKSNHNKYAKIVREIADSLPGKGDCNPITERDCYCAQPETAEDPQYCLISQEAGSSNFPPGTIAVSCVNAQMQADPNCHCRARQTCADVNFRPLFGFPQFSPQTTTGRMVRDVAGLSNGRFNPSGLNNSYGQGAFKRALQMVDKKVPVDNGPLSAGQKKMMALLAQAGIPKRLATQMAKAPVNSQGRQLMARLKRQAAPSPRVAMAKIPSFSAGKDPFRQKKSATGQQKNPFFPFNKNKKRTPQNRDDIIRFAQQAQSKASISRQRGKNIFQLISHRYQNGGWEKLEFYMP